MRLASVMLNVLWSESEALIVWSFSLPGKVAMQVGLCLEHCDLPFTLTDLGSGI